MVSVVYASVAAALCALASLSGSATALDKELYGMNYDLRRGPDWDANKCKTADMIANDLKTLSAITKRVRTYALNDCDVRPVLLNAKKLKMTVWLGVWVSADPVVFNNEVAVAQKLFDEGLIDSNVVGFNVGSEAVYRGDITAEEAISYITEFRKFLTKNSLKVPVAITDIVDTMLAYPDLVAAGDVVTINQFPFWEKMKADKAAAQFKTRIAPLLELAGDKEVIITETGWSTGGENVNASDSSPASASRYLNDFYQLATAQKWKYYYFQGFDSEYKAKMEGEENTVEAYFGLYGSDGKMKSAYADLKFGDLTTVSKDKTTTAPSSEASSGTSSKDASGSTDKDASKSSSSTDETGTNTDETDADAGPGKVNAGSADSAVDMGAATTPSAGSANSSPKNVSSSNKNSTTAPKASGSNSLLASTLSAAVVLVSVMLVSL